MRYFVIPARKGSKGFQFKNRILLEYTLNEIPKKYYKNVIISTNDEVIVNKVKTSEIMILKREKELADNKASMKSVLIDVIQKTKLNDNDDIILLYLTYPERNFKEIEKAYNFYKDHSTLSLLCAKKVKSHPYLVFYRLKNNRGKPIINHDFYRRQDYPECFEISLYICILKVGYIDHLNDNLYSKDTIFYDIKDKIDVDTVEDYNNFLKKTFKDI